MSGHWIQQNRLLCLVLCALCVLVATAATTIATTAATSEWSQGHRPSRAELPALDGAPTVKASATDPIGDTFGVGATQVDLVGLEAEVLGDALVVTLTFDSAPTPPGGGTDGLDGFVDLDLDQDGATGDLPWTDFLRPDSGPSSTGDTGMGNEAYIDLFTYQAPDGSGPGTVDVVDDVTELVLGQASALFSGSELVLRVPRSVIGGVDAADVAAVVGTIDEPTDLAPNEGSVAADETPVVALHDGRFRVEATWRDFDGNTGPGRLVTASDDSALLWFFGPDNWELLVKVLDACSVNDRYWVFSAATTNVEYTLRVTDTLSGVERVYSNDLGVAAPAVTDTDAFATCP